MCSLLSLVVIGLGIASYTAGAPCASRQHIGHSLNTVDVLSPDPAETNATLLFIDTSHQISCCGEIINWHLHHEGLGNISFDVWRPIGDNQYLYLGGNEFESTTSSITAAQRHVALDRKRIQVEVGDVIGFKNIGPPILRYDTCTPGVCTSDSVFFHYDVTVEHRDVYEWTGLQTTTLGIPSQRRYAFNADVNPKPAPRCRSEDITLNDRDPEGTHIYTVVSRHVDTDHPGTIFTVVSSEPPLDISISPQTGEVINTARFEPDVPSTTYNVTFNVTDACTGETGTCLVSFIIRARPREVILTTLPATITLDRAARGPKLLHVVTVSKQRDGDVLSCEIAAVLPDSDIFTIRNISLVDFEINLKDGTDIDFAETDQHVIVVHCENDHDFHNTSTLTIDLIPSNDVSYANFWIAGVVMGAIIIMALGILIACILQQKGLLKVWPNSASDPPSINSANSSNRLLMQEAPSISKSVDKEPVSPSMVRSPWDYHRPKHVHKAGLRSHLTSHYISNIHSSPGSEVSGSTTRTELSPVFLGYKPPWRY